MLYNIIALDFFFRLDKVLSENTRGDLNKAPSLILFLVFTLKSLLLFKLPIALRRSSVYGFHFYTSYLSVFVTKT